MSGLRDLLLTVLSTTATKREARHYIQKYRLLASQKRIALVRVSGTQNFLSLNEKWGPSLGRTLSHMKDLGSYPVVILDGSPQIKSYLGNSPNDLREYKAQLIEQASNLGSPISSFSQKAQVLSSPFELSMADGLKVKRDWVDKALAHGKIPIMLPFMYDKDTNETKFIDSYKACKAVALSLHSGDSTASTGISGDAEPAIVLDKLIFIDPLGGLPSQRRRNAAHVIVNLQQEFGDISAEIRSSPDLDASSQEAHLANLNAMREILAVGGPQTTGLITDPRAAGTVMDRNPLIYNLLTERPLISPSLPAELLRSQLRTSLVRTGFPVYVRHAKSSEGGLDLRREDKVGNINLTKLKHLIELSFNKQLDLDHYLSRLSSSVAAIIVVGDYDGAAIITWEQGVNRRIAYLDKFAVNPSSQGAQGVADIMLIQMIRRLFPDEMVWRSRFGNPVNKWYFERSRGHKRLENSNWVMFWISDAAVPPIEEYEVVCRGIEPSLIPWNKISRAS